MSYSSKTEEMQGFLLFLFFFFWGGVILEGAPPVHGAVQLQANVLLNIDYILREV